MPKTVKKKEKITCPLKPVQEVEQSPKFGYDFSTNNKKKDKKFNLYNF